MVNTSGDVYPYRDVDFDKRTKTGKHFIQFWRNKCEESKSMIPLLVEIDEALGQGAEDIWIARVQTNIHSELKQRFNINITPVVVYVVDGKFYTYEGFWRLPDVLEYLRGGYLSDVGKEIPPPIGPLIEVIESPPPSKYELLLDWIFGEPDVIFSERKAVLKLKRFTLYCFISLLIAKAFISKLRGIVTNVKAKVD
jgi:hypothetical protein